jgi:DNA-binding NtrC family response regulator
MTDSLHVLLLDGHDVRRRALSALLRAEGHVTIAEATGAAAAAALVAGPGSATPPFDLLVLDLSLPGLDVALLRRAVAPAAAAAPDSLDAAERRHLVTVLEHTRGNRRQAARILGISRSTLLNKIRKYGIDRAGKVGV